MIKRIFKTDFNFHLFLLGLVIILAIWSSINPLSKLLWQANFVVGLIYLLVFVLTYKKFQFTNLVYILIFVHLIIIFVAAKYTYENNPLFCTIQEMLGSCRNDFDRLGHLFQGIVPVLIGREFMLRKGYMKKSKFFYIVLVLMTLGASALWELGEFVSSVMTNNVQAYLISSQGDIWDAEWDMTMALVGSILSLIAFSRTQDMQIQDKEMNK